MATTTLTSEQAAVALNARPASSPFRGGADKKPQQLSFDVGISPRAKPDFASLKISGELPIERDLLYGEHLTVTISDAHGEVIVTRPATCGWPAFKDKTDKYSTTTERVHTASLD